MENLLDRGKVIRAFLVAEDLHYPWMVNQLARRGFRVDRSELSAALTGRRAFPKSMKIIDTCEQIISIIRKTTSALTLQTERRSA